MIRPRRRILAAGLAVLGAASLAIGGYMTWRFSPPPLPETAEQALDVLGSSRFERLPDHRKREYLEQARGLFMKLPPERRGEFMSRMRSDQGLRDVVRQAFRAEIHRRAFAYARADPAERVRLLDEAIDRMQQMRALGQRMGGGRSRNRGAEGGRSRADGDAASGSPEARSGRREGMRRRVRDWFEEGNPQTGALIGEYFRSLRRRREERGLPDRR